jgi:hypothetical protein
MRLNMFRVTVNVLYAQVFVVLIPRDPIKSALCGNVKDEAHIFSMIVESSYACPGAKLRLRVGVITSERWRQRG